MPLTPPTNETFDGFLEMAGMFGPRLLAAMAAGALIGAENQIFEKPAGLRTSLLVTLSCCLITIISIVTSQMFGGEASRITAQIITGVGFLGGGVILRNEGKIRGITTAATIFVNAAIGITIGTGFIWSGMAIAVLSFGILLFLRPVDAFIDNYPPFLRLRLWDRSRYMEREKEMDILGDLHLTDPKSTDDR
jgi:putative Mg2+ transporter-C (MgtC) family protein